MTAATRGTEAPDGLRAGELTRRRILDVALRLFTERGFEGTSIRDISEELGMTKSALYYHFANKDAIATALFGGRRQELTELLTWIREQEPAPDLVRRAALRWVERATSEQLRGMRFAHANQPVMRRLAGGEHDIRGDFDRVVEALVGPDAPASRRLYVKMAFDTLGAALLAAEGTDVPDRDILAAARRATLALTVPDDPDRPAGPGESVGLDEPGRVR